MSLASHRIILGNALTLDIPSGHELRADRTVNGTSTTSTITAGDDGAEFRPSELGRYYLATREDSASDWCPAGLLEVVNLANAEYEAILSELETVNALLVDAGTVNSLVQYQVTTPDGTSVTRMTVRALHKHRGDLEARKAAYERVYSGRLPVRFN